MRWCASASGWRNSPSGLKAPRAGREATCSEDMMLAALRWMKLRLGQRPDSEHVQVLVRIAITALFCVYLGWLVKGGSASGAIYVAWLILLAELALSFVLMAMILVNPGVSHVRRWVGMLADYGA